MDNRVEIITVHCTDTDNGYSVNLKAIEADHIKRGFGGIGYHLLIQPDGTQETTRFLNVKGAHVQGHNTNNIGVALVGTDKFTIQQFDKLRYFLESMEWAYSWRPWNLFCHYEYDTARRQGKSCPNIRIGDLVAWYTLKKDDPIAKYLK